MKKIRIRKVTAAGVTAGVMLGAAAFLPGCNSNEGVYGPPQPIPVLTETPAVTITPQADQTIIPDATDEPVFDPDVNVPEDVYGPPEIFEPYEEEGNINPPVYGPPPGDMPGEVYNPEENIPETVYGPPEDVEMVPVTPVP